MAYILENAGWLGMTIIYFLSAILYIDAQSAIIKKHAFEKMRDVYLHGNIRYKIKKVITSEKNQDLIDAFITGIFPLINTFAYISLLNWCEKNEFKYTDNKENILTTLSKERKSINGLLLWMFYKKKK